MDVAQQLKLLMQGCSEVIAEDELRERLEQAQVTKRPLLIKAGFDPSSSDIHLGHTVLLNKLRQFQDCGHKVCFLVGDATARIGDPSGRSQTRPMLSEREIKSNARTYQKQAFKILNSKLTQTVYNSKWLLKLGLEGVMDLMSRVTVRHIIDRDDFQKRLSQGHPVSMMELLYPLMQAYDSVAIKADIELGGTDQKFNLLLGRELQKSFNIKPQIVMTLPLLVGLDGKQKMSKSLHNHIGITDAPNDMFGKLMSISDEAMLTYYNLLTDQDAIRLQEDLVSGKQHPKQVKEALASLIVQRFFSKALADKARAAFIHVFSQKEMPRDLTVKDIKQAELGILQLMVALGLVQSSSEGRRMIGQNAVTLNGKRLSDSNMQIRIEAEPQLLKVGKRRFAKFRRRAD